MWLVAYLYNNNGMGTWCWETAHALAEAGEDVVLACAPGLSLPVTTAVRVVEIEAPPLTRIGKLLGPGGLVSRHGPRVVRHLLSQVGPKDVRGVLLNSTEFYDAHVDVPQFVVAWARGVRFHQYLVRFAAQEHGSTREFTRGLLGTIGWWRRDWFAYRHADRVLSVSSPLVEELRASGITSSLVYPCTHSPEELRVSAPVTPLRLVTSAVSLSDPRKRVMWLLEALKQWRGAAVTLTLVGAADEAVHALAKELPFPVRVLGAVPREAALRVVSESDVFLFASSLDDWGYVVSEAMARGVAVVAPRQSPFDEMIGSTGALYAPQDASSFTSALGNVLSRAPQAKADALLRARTLFSRPAFVEQLYAALE